MSLKVSTKVISALESYLWEIEISPEEVQLIGNERQSEPGFSIIIADDAEFDDSSGRLFFSLQGALVLRKGIEANALVLKRSSQDMENDNVAIKPRRHYNGDSLFLTKLDDQPSGLQELGKELLQGVRNFYQGGLKYKENSQKFVESPDNFWTVRIQPRVQTLRITLYGRPNHFESIEGITFKPDMGSYTNFLISSMSQLKPALTAIRHAMNLKVNK